MKTPPHFNRDGSHGGWLDPETFVGYGYAPGNYMCKCHSCGEIFDRADKRAITCLPCVKKLIKQSQGDK